MHTAEGAADCLSLITSNQLMLSREQSHENIIKSKIDNTLIIVNRNKDEKWTTSWHRQIQP